MTTPAKPTYNTAPDLLRNAKALVRFLIENDDRWQENQFVLDLHDAITQAEGGTKS